MGVNTFLTSLCDFDMMLEQALLKKPSLGELSRKSLFKQAENKFELRKQLDQWYRDQHVNVTKIRRSQDRIYRALLRVHKERKRLQVELMQRQLAEEQKEGQEESNLLVLEAKDLVDKDHEPTQDVSSGKDQQLLVLDDKEKQTGRTDPNDSVKTTTSDNDKNLKVSVHKTDFTTKMDENNPLKAKLGNIPSLGHEDTEKWLQHIQRKPDPQDIKSQLVNQLVEPALKPEKRLVPREMKSKALEVNMKALEMPIVRENSGELNAKEKEFFLDTSIKTDKEGEGANTTDPKSLRKGSQSKDKETRLLALPSIKEGNRCRGTSAASQVQKEDRGWADQVQPEMRFNWTLETDHQKPVGFSNELNLLASPVLPDLRLTKSWDLSKMTLPELQQRRASDGNVALSLAHRIRLQRREEEQQRRQILDREQPVEYERLADGSIVPTGLPYKRAQFPLPSQRQQAIRQRLLEAQVHAGQLQRNKMYQFFQQIEHQSKFLGS